METKTNTLTGRVPALSLLILGWCLSSYLLFRSNLLSHGEPNLTFDFCKSVFGSSCDEVLTSSGSWQLGFPLAAWGLAYFGLLGFLLVIQKPITDRLVILLAAFGAGISLIQSAFIVSEGLHCSLCLTVHFINILALVSILRSIRPFAVDNGQESVISYRPMLKYGLLMLLTIVISGFSEVYVITYSIGNKTAASLNRSYKDFRKEAVFQFPCNDFSPQTGSANAQIQLVVFSSFQCPGCMTFGRSVGNLLSRFGDNLNITFKNYPLSSNCNPALTHDMQPNACDAALAAIAAGKQGRFWEYHDQLFQSDLEAQDSTLMAIAKKLALNLEQWDTDRHLESSLSMISADVSLANEIGIQATPTVFLNGRKVSNTLEPFLIYLINEELKRISKQ